MNTQVSKSGGTAPTDIKVETPSAPASSNRAAPVSFADLDRWLDEHLTNGWLAPLRGHWPRWSGWPELKAPFEGRWPKVDVVDRETEILVRAELPGVAKDDIEVSVTDRAVTIKARTQSESKEEKEQYYRSELSRGEFERTLVLPHDVEADGAKAALKDGILELCLPKQKRSAAKQVKVA